MASEWQTAFVVSQNTMVCLAHCRQELQQKSWNTARLFLQDQDKDQMFKTKTKTKTSWSKTKTFIFVLEVPRDQDPSLEDYITVKMSHFFIQNCCCITASFTASTMNSWTVSLHWSCLCWRCYHPYVWSAPSRECPPINAFAAILGFKLCRPEHSQKKISGQNFPQISGHTKSCRPKPCTDKGWQRLHVWA